MVESRKQDLNNDILAVITAAVASMSTRPGTKLVIRSYRRVPQASPVWNTIGRLDRLRTNL